jgi:hypothetical protein
MWSGPAIDGAVNFEVDSQLERATPRAEAGRELRVFPFAPVNCLKGKKTTERNMQVPITSIIGIVVHVFNTDSICPTTPHSIRILASLRSR